MHYSSRWRAAFAVILMGLSSLMYVSFTAGAAYARSGLSLGVTMAAPQYASTFAQFAGSKIDSVRVFSSNGQGLPSWSDSRIQQLKAQGVVPFISWKDVVSTATFTSWLNSKPADIPMVYLAHCHECEANMDAATYKSRQVMYWNALNSIPATQRAKFKFGPIQTKQWTENTAGRSYATYDPGIGDFWGVDAYVNTWDLDQPNAVYPNLGYPDHVVWMAKIDAYNTGGRPKWLPELGTVSAYYDDNDQKRGLWLSRVVNYMEADSQYKLALWWHEEGTGGSSLPYYGPTRNFRLNQHRECNSGGTGCVTTTTSIALQQWKIEQNENTP